MIPLLAQIAIGACPALIGVLVAVVTWFLKKQDSRLDRIETSVGVQAVANAVQAAANIRTERDAAEARKDAADAKRDAAQAKHDLSELALDVRQLAPVRSRR